MSTADESAERDDLTLRDLAEFVETAADIVSRGQKAYLAQDSDGRLLQVDGQEPAASGRRRTLRKWRGSPSTGSVNASSPARSCSGWLKSSTGTSCTSG